MATHLWRRVSLYRRVCTACCCLLFAIASNTSLAEPADKRADSAQTEAGTKYYDALQAEEFSGNIEDTFENFRQGLKSIDDSAYLFDGYWYSLDALEIVYKNLSKNLDKSELKNAEGDNCVCDERAWLRAKRTQPQY